MAWTIYCHIHHESGRRYVGLTKRTWQERWRGHVHGALGKRVNTHFAAAIRKYGKDAFSHEILQYCYTLEEANEREQYWISHFDTRNPLRGFNLAPGGDHVPHENRLNYLTPEFRKKASEIAKARWRDPIVRAKNTAASKAALADPAVRAKISDAAIASHSRPGFRERKSSISKEVTSRPDVLTKISNAARASQNRYVAPKKDYCIRGHDLSLDVYAHPAGYRVCRACRRERCRATSRSSVSGRGGGPG